MEVIVEEMVEREVKYPILMKSVPNGGEYLLLSDGKIITLTGTFSGTVLREKPDKNFAKFKGEVTLNSNDLIFKLRESFKLMKSSISGRIVLMTSSHATNFEGVNLTTSKENEDVEFRVNWLSSAFEPFNGTVTLRNN